MSTQRLIVHIPRWLRWSLLVVLALLVIGFSTGFFLGLGSPGYSDWMQPSVAVVQIALAAIAYITLLFFTESAESPAALTERCNAIMTRLLPEALGRITDTTGEPVAVTFGPPSGIVGRAFTLRSTNTRLKLWVGLNVHRAIVAYFVPVTHEPAAPAVLDELRTLFAPTLKGALAVGYDEATMQVESLGSERFASIWLTWDLSKNRPDDFLTHTPSQLFFTQDVALMTQSFLRTAQRAGIEIATACEPMPL